MPIGFALQCVVKIVVMHSICVRVNGLVPIIHSSAPRVLMRLHVHLLQLDMDFSPCHNCNSNSGTSLTMSGRRLQQCNQTVKQNIQLEACSMLSSSLHRDLPGWICT